MIRLWKLHSLQRFHDSKQLVKPKEAQKSGLAGVSLLWEEIVQLLLREVVVLQLSNNKWHVMKVWAELNFH